MLGPNKKILEEIEAGTIPAIRDLKKSDKALLTRGLWQLSTSSEDLIAWIEKKAGKKIDTVWPVISHQAAVNVDSITRFSFLNPLLNSVCVFPDARWRSPQWLRVSDLEALAHCAQEGQLEMAALLEKKDRQARDASFSHFLYQEYSGFPMDPVLDEVGNELMRKAANRFWPTESKKREKFGGKPNGGT
jgi:hypothetical protein